MSRSMGPLRYNEPISMMGIEFTILEVQKRQIKKYKLPRLSLSLSVMLKYIFFANCHYFYKLYTTIKVIKKFRIYYHTHIMLLSMSFFRSISSNVCREIQANIACKFYLTPFVRKLIHNPNYKS